MLKKLLHTKNDYGALVARILLGLVILPHGLQKTIGAFGGHGFEATLNHFTAAMGIPAIAAILVILAESAGAIGLIVGFATRFCAFGVTMVMAGAMAMVHWKHGFFMNWFGAQAGEGFEYHLLAIGLALLLMINGGGALSIDRAIASK
ncbi:MAG: DoxX family protein [Desulfuromonadales bacterium]|nr:DoxX family protein [Desulfuromonadales bacterium]